MRKARAILFEMGFVVVAGLILALTANALSPRGLRLGQNYFPSAAGSALPARVAETNSDARPPEGRNPAASEATATLRRLEQRGLQLISSNEVVALFRDPRREQVLIAFIDARDDEHYQAGHIPGAWQFHHYHADTYFPVVLPVCMNAQQVVVYCTGGTCEDSEFAAVMLRDAGVPRSSLFVYAGGITEWKGNGLPVETGGRGSGQLLNSKP